MKWLLLIVVLLFIILPFTLACGPKLPVTDEDRQAYASLQQAYPDCMSFRALKRIRDDNELEKREFGDGTDAPHYPALRYNAGFTLKRGVWILDGLYPSNKEIDAFREAQKKVAQ